MPLESNTILKIHSSLLWFKFMVFTVTFNNIAVISWQSIFLVEETRPEKTTDLPQVTDKLYHIMSYHLSRTLNVSGDRH